MFQIGQDLSTGSTQEFEHRFGGQLVNLFIEGEFDGATLQIEAKSPSGSFVPVSESSITEPGLYLFSNDVPNTYKLSMTGEGASTLINVYINGQVKA